MAHGTGSRFGLGRLQNDSLRQDRSLKLRTPESADTRITTTTNFKMKQIFKSIRYFCYGCNYVSANLGVLNFRMILKKNSLHVSRVLHYTMLHDMILKTIPLFSLIIIY